MSWASSVSPRGDAAGLGRGASGLVHSHMHPLHPAVASSRWVLLPPCLGASSTPTSDCLSNQALTLWDANEPFLGDRNPRELISALQPMTAEGTSVQPQTQWDGHYGVMVAPGRPHGNGNLSLPRGSACLQGCCRMPTCTFLPVTQPGAACTSWNPPQSHSELNAVYSVPVPWSSWGQWGAGSGGAEYPGQDPSEQCWCNWLAVQRTRCRDKRGAMGAGSSSSSLLTHRVG